MIKTKDGYAKLIGTTYSGSVSRVLLSNGGDYVLGNSSNNIPLNNGTVNTNLNADKVDGYHVSSLWRSDGATWNPSANVSLNASANNQEWSFDIRRNGYTGCYWHVWDSSLNSMLKVNADNGKVYAPYNFVGNLEGNASTSTKLLTTRTIWGQSFNGTANVDNTLRIRQTTGNYCEGIRIQTGDGTWATIILGATADNGTNTNAWSIHRKADNNFAISRNSSDGVNGLVMTSTGMGLGTTAPTHRLDVRGDTKITGSIRDLAIGGGIYWNPYVESTTDSSDAASITVVRSGVAGGTTLVLSLMNDSNDTILFKTNTAARLYHNSYPILTTLNTYVSNNKGYINGAEITLVNNASSATTATKLASTGYANNALSYYQTDQSFDGSATGWSHYIIANHHDGASYYHYTIRLPFWSVPQYRRLTGNTSNVTSWYNFITAENIGSQSVNYATSAGNADTLDNYHANSLLTALSNSNNGVSITVGGTTKNISNISVSYANSADNANTVDGYHASKFPYINNSGIWKVYGNSAAAALADNTTGLSSWAFGESRNSGRTYLGILKSSTATCGISAHGTIVVFGQGDTHLGIASDYSSANLQVFGGNADKIVWRKKVAFTSDIPTVTNYWWANVKISNASNTDTLPTFGYATIKNRLSISSSTITKTAPIHLQLVINGPNLDSSVTPGLKDWPGIGFHMPNRGWASLIYNGNITAINSNYDGYINYFGSGFKKNGSNDTYVLLGGGGHKLISDFATSGHTHTLRLESTTGTNSITLAHGGKYKLTAGGNSVIFTLPTDNNTNPANFYWANVKVSATSSTSTTPQFSKVKINTDSSSYQLNVKGDSYTTGWSRATNGFYCESNGVYFTHNGTKGEISVKNNNEFCWGSNSETLYFNYAAPSNGTTVKNYIWNAGSGSTYASHTTGNITLGSDSNSNYQLKRAGYEASWYNGRDRAIVRQTSASGYSVIISSKTTNGSWEIGNYTSNGDSLYFTYITDTNYNNKNNTTTGQLFFDTLGSIYATHFYENSDIRYKKILRNLSIDSSTIANLPLFDFKWIENNTIGTGTSALAVQQILPNLVSGTDRLTLDYGALGTIAGITACKELVTLKSELLQLKEKVKLLEDKLRKYENI